MEGTELMDSRASHNPIQCFGNIINNSANADGYVSDITTHNSRIITIMAGRGCLSAWLCSHFHNILCLDKWNVIS